MERYRVKYKEETGGDIKPFSNDLLKNLPVEYDRHGFMKFHPFYHPNTGKKFTESDKEYLCKFFEVDGIHLISMGLGRSPRSIAQKITRMKKTGEYDTYKAINKYWTRAGSVSYLVKEILNSDCS